MNTEEDEFRRIEREALRRAARDEDDDTQVYAKPWVGLTEEEIQELRLRTFDAIATNYEIYRAIEAKLKERNT
jgi:hypothetical protein